MPGARGTRSPCALVVSTRSSPQVLRTPGIPRAMVLTVSFVLSPATNSFCHRRQRIDEMSDARLGRHLSAHLTSATDARTTRFCRTQRPPLSPRPAVCGRPGLGRGVEAPVVHAPPTAHGKPALRSRHASNAAASTTSCPASVTIASAPLRDRTAVLIILIWVRGEEKSF